MPNHDIAVSVRDLSKSYTIAHEDQKHTLATEALLHSLKNLGKKTTSETFWALKDVSFDIQKGDVVGIIGRNGAGKSTLLKVLSRITEPTSGQIDLYGRVGSLLEVGTGFHPELTGRENTYLNGAILGMSKREIAKHFDAIVDFSGVEKFLDTPVKRYSSGMYVRLAFAVAAHLEPEILIVDEVLAVGDAEFQKKCLGKMQDVAAHGRTVLFVSHNMGAVNSLCSKAMLLRQGQCIGYGSTGSMIAKYLSTGTSASNTLVNNEEPAANQKLKIRFVRALNSTSEDLGEFNVGESIKLEVGFEVTKPGVGYTINAIVEHVQFGPIFTSSSYDADPIRYKHQQWQSGRYVASLNLPSEFLRAGQYVVKVVATVPMVEYLDTFSQEFSFALIDVDSPMMKMGEVRGGAITPTLEWRVADVNTLDLPSFSPKSAVDLDAYVQA